MTTHRELEDVEYEQRSTDRKLRKKARKMRKKARKQEQRVYERVWTTTFSVAMAHPMMASRFAMSRARDAAQAAVESWREEQGTRNR